MFDIAKMEPGKPLKPYYVAKKGKVLPYEISKM